jgi:hypothetical protein
MPLTRSGLVVYQAVEKIVSQAGNICQLSSLIFNILINGSFFRLAKLYFLLFQEKSCSN